MEDITVFSHLDCIAKDNGENHPERKERLEVILDSIKNIDELNISLKEAPLADSMPAPQALKIASLL